MNQIIGNALRQRSRRNAAVEESGSNSEDTEADKAWDTEWEDILGTIDMGRATG